MYVTINKQGMYFVHAHPDRRVCVLLANIELPHVQVAVLSIEHPQDLLGFTDMELQLLYKSSTGQQAPGYFRDHTARALAAAAQVLPQADVVLAELVAQDAYVDAAHWADGDRRPYRYVKGSVKPAPVVDLFDAALLPTVTDPHELLRRAAALPARAEPTPASAPPAAPVPRQGAANAPPSAPGAGSVTERIFAVCDACLAELRPGGLPGRGMLAADELLLAQARKLAIPRLEAAGVNPNSARKGSSMWIQARR